LSRLLRLPDTAARLGSDEFVVVIDDFESHASVEAVAKHILISAMTKFQLNGHDCQVLASIGIALHGPKCADVDLLIKAADAAMYAAKRNGKNGFQFYDEASRT
jgi:diguanylate cyclase (GGDEF)-like protein